jgi:hypothetical protein
VSLPPRPATLVGRENLLSDVQSLLTEGSAPRVVVLTGMGGVGKTSTAAEYAHRHLAEVSVAWQIPAEDPTVLTQDMTELAAQLGGRDVIDPRDPVASVHAVLAAWPTEWVLIFDNAPDEASVRRFVPPVGRGRVILTSQSQHWPGKTVLDVPVLDSEVAARFLVSRTGDPDEFVALEVARELGGLPLALEQAAAYALASGLTLAAYLAVFRQRRAELMERGVAAGHPLTVAATIGLAFSRLEGESPTAVGVLRLLAFLAPEPVPLGMIFEDTSIAASLPTEADAVLGRLLGDPIALGDAVATMRQYSLITSAGHGTVLMHRLVQAYLLSHMPAEAVRVWRDVATALTGAAIPADTRLPDTWSACAMLLPHARAALGLTSDGMWRIAWFLGYSGSYSVALNLFGQITRAYENDPDHGAEHPATLAARHSLARWTGEAGNRAKARDLFGELLPIREKVLGAEHPDTLTARHELARWTGQAGDAALARDLFAELAPIREKVLGAEHTDTLTTRSGLASWTGQAGDAARARDLFAELLPTRQQVSGSEHPSTLAARHELARFTGEAGDAALARDLFAELLPTREKVLGAEHPETLNTRAHLARFTGEAGDPFRARDLFAELLPIRRQVSGSEHPSTLTARHELARFTGEAGDPFRARDLFAELLPIRQQVSGPQHPDTLAASHNLAYWTRQAEMRG